MLQISTPQLQSVNPDLRNMTPATTDRINDRRAPQGPRQSTLAILRQLARTYCVSSALPATLNGYLAN